MSSPKITWEVPGGQGVHKLPEGAEVTVKLGGKSITVCAPSDGICVREDLHGQVKEWKYPKGRHPEGVFIKE